MKRLILLLLCCTTLAFSVCALAEDATPEAAARAVVPENAELLRTEKDDGMLEYLFITPDDMRYQVEVNPSTLAVEHVEIKAVEKRGGKSVVLTKEQAEETVRGFYPEATILFAATDREDGMYVYEVKFSTDKLIGKAELNAETGALLEMELDYTAPRTSNAPLTEAEAKELVLSLVENGRITEFETEIEKGRTEYEGELIANGIEYEFTIDAATGSILEWKADLDD